jgi:asparagine synthetase B (glutamine-hydrolysing)
LTTQKIITPVIPSRQTFFKRGEDSSLDLKAICLFTASGFFLGEDTYFRNLKVMQPATEYEIDDDMNVVSSNTFWNWHYTPSEMSLDEATESFANLFEKITERLLGDKSVILPLSGGLDSRTQAVVLNSRRNVKAYSYKFENSFDETKYAKQIVEKKNFEFREYIIPSGYLWEKLELISELNQCYADFTHPRQMAHIEDISTLGDIFFLGHWGDVLFDDMKVESKLNDDELLIALEKKLVKRGGRELAAALWSAWGLEGNFDTYLKERLFELVHKINIEDANAKIRAFKSMYWAPRWTSANMVTFSHYKPVALPYYDDEMCSFICTIPEEHLAKRKIQINYIKKKSPELASIPWQDYDPLNLYDYEKFDSVSMIPLRALRKGKRILNEKLFGKVKVTRNWEIQFCGEENEKKLKERLFGNARFSQFVPVEVTSEFYDKFRKEDSVRFSHPVSMLLTLSEFSRMNLNGS